MKFINIGIVGSGFAAIVHVNAYKKVYGINVKLKAITSLDKHISDFANKYGIEKVYKSYEEMLQDNEIDIIDICTPTFLHEGMIVNAIKAGKDVICEKPLTAYFCVQGNKKIVSKRDMFEKVIEKMDKLQEIIEKSGKKFMYAENWIYSPAIQKTAEIIRKTGNKVLFMKGQESQGGYHTPYAGQWNLAGGGTLLRLGSHPIAAILYLKKVESEILGQQIKVTNVYADVATLTHYLTEDEKKYIMAKPVDVEDWGNLLITFSDGTRASIVVGDMMIGGARNYLEVYSNSSVCICNMTPNNHMMTYVADKTILQEISIAEKLETKEGWQYTWLSEEVVRGFNNEIQDFMECIVYKRKPHSDFGIAYDTVKTIYAGYVSSEERKRIEIV